jgi:hypothetical protein
MIAFGVAFVVVATIWLVSWVVMDSARSDVAPSTQTERPAAEPAGAPSPRRAEAETPTASDRTPWQSYTAALDATQLDYEDLPSCVDNALARAPDRSFEAIRKALGGCRALLVPPPAGRSAIVLLVQRELRQGPCTTSTITADGVSGEKTDAQLKAYLACTFKLDSTELYLADYVALGVYLAGRTK